MSSAQDQYYLIASFDMLSNNRHKILMEGHSVRKMDKKYHNTHISRWLSRWLSGWSLRNHKKIDNFAEVS